MTVKQSISQEYQCTTIVRYKCTILPRLYLNRTLQQGTFYIISYDKREITRISLTFNFTKYIPICTLRLSPEGLQLTVIKPTASIMSSLGGITTSDPQHNNYDRFSYNITSITNHLILQKSKK